jgi:hypothetical protein
MRIGSRFALAIGIVLLNLGVSQPLLAASPPYPPSPLIAAISFDNNAE